MLFEQSSFSLQKMDGKWRILILRKPEPNILNM